MSWPACPSLHWDACISFALPLTKTRHIRAVDIQRCSDMTSGSTLQVQLLQNLQQGLLRGPLVALHKLGVSQSSLWGPGSGVWIQMLQMPAKKSSALCTNWKALLERSEFQSCYPSPQASPALDVPGPLPIPFLLPIFLLWLCPTGRISVLCTLRIETASLLQSLSLTCRITSVDRVI